jgi:hypothetical protein
METKCPLIRNAVNAWLPGDLNRMFERITTDPSFKQYSESLRPTFQARIPMKRQTISWDRGCLHILRISCLTNPSALFKSVTISVPEKSHGSENWTRPVMLDSGINSAEHPLGANDCAIIPTPDYRCAPSHRGADADFKQQFRIVTALAIRRRTILQDPTTIYSHGEGPHPGCTDTNILFFLVMWRKGRNTNFPN